MVSLEAYWGLGVGVWGSEKIRRRREAQVQWAEGVSGTMKSTP